MIGNYISLIFKGTSIIRWNNFPRVENITETDNSAIVLHTIVLLSWIIEEKEGIKFDLNYIFMKMFFNSMLTFSLSDINSDVKNRIKKKNNILFTKLELKIYNILKSLDIPDTIKSDLELFMKSDVSIFGNSFEKENKLIKFCKIWVAYKEASKNAIVYKESYYKVIKDFEKTINSGEFDIFLKYFDTNIINYFETIRNLQFSRRWNKMSRIYPISVMSHLYIVFCIGYFISSLEHKTIEQKNSLLIRCLYHDISEAITGDIVSPTKKVIEGFESLLDQVESEMIDEYLLVHLSDYKFKDDVRELLLNPKKGEIGKLMKYADYFSALFEAKIESENNAEFKVVYHNLKKFLDKFEIDSIDYLMKYGIEYFDDNIDVFILKNF